MCYQSSGGNQLDWYHSKTTRNINTLLSSTLKHLFIILYILLGSLRSQRILQHPHAIRSSLLVLVYELVFTQGSTWLNFCLLDVNFVLLYVSINRCVCNIDCSGYSFNPVCASDGSSYNNPCFVREASCLRQEQIDIRHLGHCSGRLNFVFLVNVNSDMRGLGRALPFPFLIRSHQSSYQWTPRLYFRVPHTERYVYTTYIPTVFTLPSFGCCYLERQQKLLG